MVGSSDESSGSQEGWRLLRSDGFGYRVAVLTSALTRFGTQTSGFNIWMNILMNYSSFLNRFVWPFSRSSRDKTQWPEAKSLRWGCLQSRTRRNFAGRAQDALQNPSVATPLQHEATNRARMYLNHRQRLNEGGMIQLQVMALVLSPKCWSRSYKSWTMGFGIWCVIDQLMTDV